MVAGEHEGNWLKKNWTDFSYIASSSATIGDKMLCDTDHWSNSAGHCKCSRNGHVHTWRTKPPIKNILSVFLTFSTKGCPSVTSWQFPLPLRKWGVSTKCFDVTNLYFGVGSRSTQIFFFFFFNTKLRFNSLKQFFSL